MYLSLIFQYHVWLIILYQTRYFLCIYSIDDSLALTRNSRRNILGIEYSYLSYFGQSFIVSSLPTPTPLNLSKNKYLFQLYFFCLWACFGLLVSNLTDTPKETLKLECVRATKFSEREDCHTATKLDSGSPYLLPILIPCVPRPPSSVSSVAPKDCWWKLANNRNPGCHRWANEVHKILMGLFSLR